jgi:3-oxoacyl-[acyl-carrier protein] reductase
MDLELRGRTVLITGGSQGIGLATARAFAAEGCNLHLAARTESRLQEARCEIVERFGARVEIHPIDISIGDNALALARVCGEVDILVNNAGAVPGGSLEQIDEARWRKAWDLKVFGYINMTREMHIAMGLATRSRRHCQCHRHRRKHRTGELYCWRQRHCVSRRLYTSAGRHEP